MLASLGLQSSSGVFFVHGGTGPLLFMVPVMQSSPISVGDDGYGCMESQQRDKPRGSGC